jgi:hypothetical protein
MSLTEFTHSSAEFYSFPAVPGRHGHASPVLVTFTVTPNSHNNSHHNINNISNKNNTSSNPNHPTHPNKRNSQDASSQASRHTPPSQKASLSQSSSPVQQKLLVYFPGDIQSTDECMRSPFSGQYARYSLNQIGDRLRERFPGYVVVIVRPSSMTEDIYACYAPEFYVSTVGGGKSYYDAEGSRKPVTANVHLAGLLAFLQTALRNDFEVDVDLQSIVLVAFSKGCTVIHQTLNEMSAPAFQSLPIGCRFWRNPQFHVTDVVLLDPGNYTFAGAYPGISGNSEEQVTEEEEVGGSVEKRMMTMNEDIARMWKQDRTRVHLHITPYTLGKTVDRPTIHAEHDRFVRAMKTQAVDFRRVEYFFNKFRQTGEAGLDMHFNLLEHFVFQPAFISSPPSSSSQPQQPSNNSYVGVASSSSSSSSSSTSTMGTLSAR